jgi:hypothetical protein
MGGIDILLGAGIVRGEPQEPGFEQAERRITGVELHGFVGRGRGQPGRSLPVLDVSEGGEENGGGRVLIEGLLDDNGGVGDLLLAQKNLGHAGDEVDVVRALLELRLVEAGGLAVLALEVRLLGFGGDVGFEDMAGGGMGLRRAEQDGCQAAQEGDLRRMGESVTGPGAGMG